MEVVVTEQAPIVTSELDCPVTLMGPSNAGECSSIVVSTVPATNPVGGLSCPQGFTLSGNDCSRDVAVNGTVGIVLISQDVCPSGYQLFGDTCIRSYPAIAGQCPQGAVGPINEGGSTICQEQIPPIPVNSANCPDGQTRPVNNLCSSQEAITVTFPAIASGAATLSLIHI